jgi:hypothetical protein
MGLLTQSLDLVDRLVPNPRVDVVFLEDVAAKQIILIATQTASASSRGRQTVPAPFCTFLSGRGARWTANPRLVILV